MNLDHEFVHFYGIFTAWDRSYAIASVCYVKLYWKKF